MDLRDLLATVSAARNLFFVLSENPTVDCRKMGYSSDSETLDEFSDEFGGTSLGRSVFGSHRCGGTNLAGTQCKLTKTFVSRWE